jgi:hypothetical protein
MDCEPWQRALHVNLDSQPYQTATRLTGRGGWGCIVGITSNSRTLPALSLSHCMVSQMGVIGSTRALAAASPSTQSAPPTACPRAGAHTLTRSHRATVDDPGHQGPVGPEDIVGVVLFLVSEDG